MATTLLLEILRSRKIQLPDRDLALLESHREENILTLQNYYKTEEMFLEIFEDEYLCVRDYSLENLLQDSALLLPPVGSPLSFVAIDRRRPCGEVRDMVTHHKILRFTFKKDDLTVFFFLGGEVPAVHAGLFHPTCVILRAA